MKKIFGIFMMLLSIGIFYVSFFIVAPWVISLLPQGEYHSIHSFFVYVGIALLGGAEASIWLFVIGVISLISALAD